MVRGAVSGVKRCISSHLLLVPVGPYYTPYHTLTSATRCLQVLRGAAKGCSRQCLQVLHLSLEVDQGGHGLALRRLRVGRLAIATEGLAEQGAGTVEDGGGRVEALADGEQPGEGWEGGVGEWLGGLDGRHVSRENGRACLRATRDCNPMHASGCSPKSMDASGCSPKCESGVTHLSMKRSRKSG